MNRASARHAIVSVSVSAAIGLAVSACTERETEPGAADGTVGEAKEAMEAIGHILVGSLEYGQISQPVTTSGLIRYRAFRFEGEAGDQVTIDVRSTNGGDAKTWLLHDFDILAFNDDGPDGTADSHIEFSLEESGTHYILFRDAAFRRRTFTVELQGGPPDAAPLSIGFHFTDSRLVTFDPVAGTIEQVHLQMDPENFIGMTYDPNHNLLYVS